MEVIYLSLRDGHVDRAAAFDRQSWEEFVDAVVTADERINEGTESLESIDVE